MKKLLLVFVSVLLLGSSAYAQVKKDGTPDWRSFPGAKKIIDNMETSALAGITLEDAVKENPDIYLPKKALELASLAELEELPLSISADYLSKLSKIINIFNVNALPPGSEIEMMLANEGVSVFGKPADSKLLDEISTLVRARDKANKKLNGRPLKHLLARLDSYGLKDLKDALEFFVNKQKIGLIDIDVILGTAPDGFKDGLLLEAYSAIEGGPCFKNVFQPLVSLLHLKLLCSDLATRSIEVMLAEHFSALESLAKEITDGTSEADFTPSNTALAKIVKIEDISKGLENFRRISGLIEKK